MLYRSVETTLNEFKKSRKALLLTGARQVGKSYIVREFGKKNYRVFVEINFLRDRDAITLLKGATNLDDILLRLSALSKVAFVPGETLFLFDEIQEFPDFLTSMKFLVEDGWYRYILTGSLLGVELKDIRSIPVGYLDIVDMHPLDFEEFLMANAVQRNVIDYLSNCYRDRKKVAEAIHEKMMALYRLYLIVGGMPEAVQAYVDTNDLVKVSVVQKQIVNLYKKEIAKYDVMDKWKLDEILEAIPAELNAKNKRFVLKNLNEKARFSRYENGFLWLKDAGVALPVYVSDEPVLPLALSKRSNLFKLFMNDTGLLASMYSTERLQLRILNKEVDINSGSIWENAVAEELTSHGFKLFYYNKSKIGEIDFLIEQDGNVLPIEVKSGKNYDKHEALDNLLNVKNYDIKEAYVFGDCNVSQDERIINYPIYMAMFLQMPKLPTSMIYTIDTSSLQVPKT